MAQNTNLNVTPYYDDFDKDKNFYRVLFRPGFPIQARELSTMQSILQNQVESVGTHLFKDGAMVIPGQVGYDLNVQAVLLQESFLGSDVETYRSQLTGTIIEGLTTGVKAKVLYSISASESEKGLGTTINDTIIHAAITEAMFKKDVNKFIGVNINVDDGVVLLTGKVDSPETRIEVTRLSWTPRGVIEVINEIQVSEKSSIKDAAKDLAASATIRGKLVADKNIKSVNFSIDVVNGVAYLSGVARSEKEMNLVLAYTKETKYINQLVNYIQLSEALNQ